MIVTGATIAIWFIALLSAAGVVIRPWRLPEATFAVAGASLLILLQLLSWRSALTAVAKGTDVYLFLTGMMLVAELGRQEGLFDWLAARAARMAAGSALRLFALTYAVGTLVTIVLSNDATAIVLTPAVHAAAVAAKAEPLPYLLVCAFIANAASFVLPISNPANLVVFQGAMPTLTDWITRFAAPSAAAIAATFVLLLATQRSALRQPIHADAPPVALTSGGRIVGIGLILMTIELLAVSFAGVDLGWPTLLAGVVILVAVVAVTHRSPLPALSDVSWSVLPLVAGLFVVVEAVSKTGVLAALVRFATTQSHHTPRLFGTLAAIVVALVCNVANNLPVGLLAGSVVPSVGASSLTDPVLIGVDLGPNLSVTGSLATILWLTALKRENVTFSAGKFLRIGAIVMLPALLAALAFVR